MKPVSTSLKRHLFFVSVIFLLVILILNTGCDQSSRSRATQYLVNTARLASSLKQLDAQVMSTHKAINQLEQHMAPDDFVTLQKTAQDVLQLRNTLHEMIQRAGGLKQFLINAEQVSLFYLQGGERYARARAIIEKNWSELPRTSQSELMSFDRQVIVLDDAFRQLMVKPDGTDITQLMTDVVTISTATAKVLMMAGVL